MQFWVVSRFRTKKSCLKSVTISRPKMVQYRVGIFCRREELTVAKDTENDPIFEDCFLARKTFGPRKADTSCPKNVPSFFDIARLRTFFGSPHPLSGTGAGGVEVAQLSGFAGATGAHYSENQYG